MSKQDPKPVQKISVKIWRPIIDKLDAKIEAACLRSDAYLGKCWRRFNSDQLNQAPSLGRPAHMGKATH